ncbi:MAG TPA: ATP-dependent Clp protease proteolytic subunit, partial [Tissierellaceae bacterium]
MKKKSIIIFLIVMLLFTNSLVFAKENKTNDKAYVIPIHGEINGATKNFVVEQINKLNNKDDVGCIIFDINTYGGLIDKAIDIKDSIISTDIKTISYVNNKAESAGVLLTIASEDIAVSQNATIGSAETIPNTEKVMSMWRAVLRDTAQHRGRNPLIIESMAEKDIFIPGVIVKGKLLNLTSQEAIELEIADVVASDYEEILNKLEIDYESIVVIEENYQIKLAKYISNP